MSGVVSVTYVCGGADVGIFVGPEITHFGLINFLRIIKGVALLVLQHSESLRESGFLARESENCGKSLPSNLRLVSMKCITNVIGRGDKKSAFVGLDTRSDGGNEVALYCLGHTEGTSKLMGRTQKLERLVVKEPV